MFVVGNIKNEWDVGRKDKRKQNDFVSDFQGSIQTVAFNWTNWIRCMIYMFCKTLPELKSRLICSRWMFYFFHSVWYWCRERKADQRLNWKSEVNRLKIALIPSMVQLRSARCHLEQSFGFYFGKTFRFHGSFQKQSCVHWVSKVAWT
jgi:hypothetical protein